MKVRLLVGRSGTRFSQAPGEVIEVSNEEGKRLIEKGRAEPVVSRKKESATRSRRESR